MLLRYLEKTVTKWVRVCVNGYSRHADFLICYLKLSSFTATQKSQKPFVDFKEIHSNTKPSIIVSIFFSIIPFSLNIYNPDILRLDLKPESLNPRP